MKFSQRIGKEPIDSDLQIDRVDEDLRVGIWNVFYRFLIKDSWAVPHATYYDEYLDDIWEFFLKKPLDERSEYRVLVAQMKKWIISCEWNQVYDFIEFMISILPPSVVPPYVSSNNKVLEQERSAYRIIDRMIMPLTDATEMNEVKEAFRNVSARGSLTIVQDHLIAALAQLGQRTGSNYELAIFEVHNAVNALAQYVTGEEGATLEDLLEEVDKNHELSKSFSSGIEELFGKNSYNMFDGIEREIALPEAKYCVVTGSAFINYILSLHSGKELSDSNDLDEQKLITS